MDILSRQRSIWVKEVNNLTENNRIGLQGMGMKVPNLIPTADNGIAVSLLPDLLQLRRVDLLRAAVAFLHPHLFCIYYRASSRLKNEIRRLQGIKNRELVA